MKITTINFWIGVFIGAGAIKFLPKVYSSFKKGFKKGFEDGFNKSIENSKATNKQLTKGQTHEIDYVDVGRVSDTSGAAIDKSSLSDLLYSKEYKTYNDSIPNDVIKSNIDYDINNKRESEKIEGDIFKDSNITKE